MDEVCLKWHTLQSERVLIFNPPIAFLALPSEVAILFL